MYLIFVLLGCLSAVMTIVFGTAFFSTFTTPNLILTLMWLVSTIFNIICVGIWFKMKD